MRRSRLPATRRSRKTFPSRNDGPAGSIERATAASRSLISCGVTVLAICYSATTGIVSDSYGYVSQADLWVRQSVHSRAVRRAGPMARASDDVCALGYRPAGAGTWAYVPIYSAGLPVFMAAARIIGGREFMFWTVPAFGGLLSWMTYAIGRRLGSTRAGLVACWLGQRARRYSMMLQPMSDVLWLQRG